MFQRSRRVPLHVCGSKGGVLGLAQAQPPGAGLALESHFSHVFCARPNTSPVGGKEALPVILIPIWSRTGVNRQLCRVVGCAKMDGPRLPSQLLLLVIITGK